MSRALAAAAAAAAIMLMMMMMIMLAAALLQASILQQQQAFGLRRALYDNFEGPPYVLADGDTSPNGKWLGRYNGHGSSGTVMTTTTTTTKTTVSGNEIFFQKPKASAFPNETYAALTLTAQEYEDVDIYLKVKTVQQLRQNSPPNPWEVAWVMWRYQDDWHHYYFIFKPNGIELGKKQNDERADEQVFLFTANEPQLAMNRWNTWNIRMVDNHIEVWLKVGLGWKKVVDYYDRNNPIEGPGRVGLYNEDAHVQFDNVYLTRIP
jgi:hypothetical protein